MLGMSPKLYLSSKKGKFHYYKNKKFINRKDYYMLDLNRKNEITQLLNKLDLKHKEKNIRKIWALNLLNYPFMHAKGVNLTTRLPIFKL